MKLKARIYNVIWKLLEIFRFYHLPLEVAQRKIAWEDSQDFIYKNTGKNTKLYSNHWKLRNDVFDIKPSEGKILEFGVFNASSTNFFADILLDKKDSRSLVGFDSFSGFSEDWTGVTKAYPKNHFDQSGRYPSVRNNVQLIDGFIEESLPRFLEEQNLEKIAFVHIDTDTYSPAKVVLSHLKPYFQKGTIILFDELVGYPNWRNHEFRALSEELERDKYEFIAFGVSSPRANLVKAAIKIL